MKTLPVVLLLTLVPALGLAQTQSEPLALGPRALRAVARYQEIVKQLDLATLPTDAPEYAAVADNVDRLGEQMEALSRLAVQTEAAAEPDWPRLANALQAFENDLRQLGGMSLALRVWGAQYREGTKKPQWGLAISRATEPLPRAQGSFDADVVETLELTLQPGETRRVQVVVVPLTKPVRQVRADVGDLKGKPGKLPAQQVQLLPVDYDRLEGLDPQGEWWRQATQPAKPDVPVGQSQVFVLTVAAPADLKPGEYAGRLRFNPEGVGSQRLEVTLTVSSDRAAPAP